MITIQIDETELVQDWQSANQALQALGQVDAKYGGTLADTLQNIKSKIRQAMKSKVETDLMADFRNQLGL